MSFGQRAQFMRRVARETTTATADVDTQLFCTRSEASFERSHYGCRNTRGVPVHSHHRSEGLKPKRITQAREKSRVPVVENDCFSDSCPEPRHPCSKPLRHAAAMERKIGCTGAVHICY